MPTNGNAGAAWATYAARAGLPDGGHAAGRAGHHPARVRGRGTELYLVDGLIGDAGRLVAGRSRDGPATSSTFPR